MSPVLKPFFFYYPKNNVQISLYLNGQHVETFEEDLAFTSDEVVSFDPPKISSELKGMFIFLFVNVSFAVFVLENHVLDFVCEIHFNLFILDIFLSPVQNT